MVEEKVNVFRSTRLVSNVEKPMMIYVLPLWHLCYLKSPPFNILVM